MKCFLIPSYIIIKGCYIEMLPFNLSSSFDILNFTWNSVLYCFCKTGCGLSMVPELKYTVNHTKLLF